MSRTDPVSDCLTKIRNASVAKHETTDVPAAKFTERILSLLKTEGYIRNYKVMGEVPKRSIRIYLKYGPGRVSAITNATRISKPGLRQYRGSKDLPRVLNGLGVAIVTTSKGLMTDKDSYRQRIGGEVIGFVW